MSVNKIFNPFDEIASEYDAWFEKDGKLIFEIELKAIKEVLPDLPSPWLEIGIGSGRFAKALNIETGVDRSMKMVNIARRRGLNVFLGKGEKKIFDDASFGTVFFITTFNFLESPVPTLKEANRILLPGGKILLGLVLKNSPWGKLYEQKKLEGHRFYKYANFYMCDEVTQMTLDAGFEGERIISTLFQKPGSVQNPEEPEEGYYPEAGFVIIVARKPENMPENK
jgi:ubiquinone/menaquinone biosynthesis C-methylase UbiE